ncbi:hypothetical protein [Janthinobacterium fluminis]|uniref:Porin n=1 Tax=Janthinobacterium fluminis TaxID=2987524 RepID=A0ABT5K9H3_9BURK|nr:hypothetical protein [Janthinobacterium fluminis]MDC8760452.1 hypothetical protein [Janthinobacterium fluminis]
MPQAHLLAAAPLYAGAGVGGADNARLYAGYRLPSLQFRGGEAAHSAEALGYAGGAGVRGIALAYVGGYKFDAFSLHARLGLGYGGAAARRLGALYGFGSAYALDADWSLHVDWDSVPGDAARGRRTLFTTGLSRRF